MNSATNREIVQWENPEAPILIQWARANRLQPGKSHFHPSVLELHIMRRGYCRYLINNHFYSMSNSNALVIQPGYKHQPFPAPGHGRQSVMIMVDLSLIHTFMSSRHLKLLPTSIILSNSELETIELWCRIIDGEMHRRQSISAQLIIRELTNILLVMERAVQGVKDEPIIDRRILKAIDLIEEDPSQALKVDNVASAVGMSPSRLSHCFSQQVKMSIKQYQLQCRIAAAKHRLETNDAVKMMDLADQLGFSDLSLFTHCFKRFAGTTPGAYRRMIRAIGSPPR